MFPNFIQVGLYSGGVYTGGYIKDINWVTFEGGSDIRGGVLTGFYGIAKNIIPKTFKKLMVPIR